MREQDGVDQAAAASAGGLQRLCQPALAHVTASPGRGPEPHKLQVHSTEYPVRVAAARLLLLFLIVSNFVFTVQDMENKDPDWVGFYSNAELAYTVLFSIGLALSDSVRI